MKYCRHCCKDLPADQFPPPRGGRAYSVGTCIQCKKSKKKRYYEDNKESILKEMAEYQKLEKVKKYQATYFQKNKEKNYQATRRWRERNPEKQKEILANDYQLRKRIWPEYVAKRRATLQRAMPDWVDQRLLRKIYQECPPGQHVDHIIPLNGKAVCGLHVPRNLQYLTAKENLQKGNRV